MGNQIKRDCNVIRMKSLARYIFSVLMIAVISAAIASSAYALGISPGRTTLDFTPNLQKTVTVKVINNEKKDMKLAIFARGDIAQHVKLPLEELSFTSAEPEKQFSYELLLPSSLDPGLRDAEIVVREIPRESMQGGQTTISALVAVVSQIQVNSPYPEKFLRISLHVKEAMPNEDILFFIPVKNLGSERIESAAPTVIIYDSRDREIQRITSETVSMASNQAHEFKIAWKANVSEGVYRAAAVVEYDGKRVAAEKKFLVGDFFLKPIDISVTNFQLGQIAKFNVLVENAGNERISDASAKITLADGSGRKVADITSLDIPIEPKERKEMPVYWDTAGVDEGEYQGMLRLGYGSKFSEKQIRTIVEQDSIRTEIIGITALAIGERTAKPVRINPLYIVLAVLVFANIIWLVYYRKKQQKGVNQQSMPPKIPPSP